MPVALVCRQCGQGFTRSPSELTVHPGAGQFCSRRCRDDWNRDPAVRFARYVARGEGCWEWQGHRFPSGYGGFEYRRRHWRAHRFAWTLAHGPIPDGMVVRHKCDNPACVRVDHLELGTEAENKRDMRERGRAAAGDRSGMRRHPERVRRGEQHPDAKLSADQVREIRRRYAAGEAGSYRLGREYGVSDGTISAIVRRRSWKHVA